MTPNGQRRSTALAFGPWLRPKGIERNPGVRIGVHLGLINHEVLSTIRNAIFPRRLRATALPGGGRAPGENKAPRLNLGSASRGQEISGCLC